MRVMSYKPRVKNEVSMSGIECSDALIAHILLLTSAMQGAKL